MSSSSPPKIDLQRFSAFALALGDLRGIFPEHAAEIDRCLYEVGQKLPSCNDPNCTCGMTFENFHAISQKIARESYEFD